VYWFPIGGDMVKIGKMFRCTLEEERAVKTPKIMKKCLYFIREYSKRYQLVG